MLSHATARAVCCDLLFPALFCRRHHNHLTWRGWHDDASATYISLDKRRRRALLWTLFFFRRSFRMFFNVRIRMLLGHVSKSQHHISIWKYLYIYICVYTHRDIYIYWLIDWYLYIYLKICHYIRIVWTFLYTDTRPKYIKVTVVALTPFTAHASALKQKLLEYTTCYFLTQGTIKRQFRHALWTPAAETFSQFDGDLFDFRHI